MQQQLPVSPPRTAPLTLDQLPKELILRIVDRWNSAEDIGYVVSHPYSTLQLHPISYLVPASGETATSTGALPSDASRDEGSHSGTQADGDRDGTADVEDYTPWLSSRDVAALARTCRRLHEVLLPTLYATVAPASVRALRRLANAFASDAGLDPTLQVDVTELHRTSAESHRPPHPPLRLLRYMRTFSMAAMVDRWADDNQLFVALEMVVRACALAAKVLATTSSAPSLVLRRPGYPALVMPAPIEPLVMREQANRAATASGAGVVVVDGFVPIQQDGQPPSIVHRPIPALPMPMHDSWVARSQHQGQLQRPEQQVASSSSTSNAEFAAPVQRDHAGMPILGSSAASIPTQVSALQASGPPELPLPNSPSAHLFSMWDLSWTKHLLDSTLQCLARGVGLHLRSIDLDRCVHIRDSGLMALAHHAPHITEIRLGGVPRMTDAALFAFAAAWSQTLRVADVSRNHRVTAHGVYQLVASCPHLVEVDARGCNELLADLDSEDPEEAGISEEGLQVVRAVRASSRAGVVLIAPVHPDEDDDDDDDADLTLDDDDGSGSDMMDDDGDDGNDDFDEGDVDDGGGNAALDPHHGPDGDYIMHELVDDGTVEGELDYGEFPVLSPGTLVALSNILPPSQGESSSSTSGASGAAAAGAIHAAPPVSHPQSNLHVPGDGGRSGPLSPSHIPIPDDGDTAWEDVMSPTDAALPDDGDDAWEDM